MNLLQIQQLDGARISAVTGPQALQFARTLPARLHVATTGVPGERLTHSLGKKTWHITYPSGLIIDWPAERSNGFFSITNIDFRPVTAAELHRRRTAAIDPVLPESQLRARARALVDNLGIPKSFKLSEERFTTAPIVANGDRSKVYQAFFSPSGKVEYPGVRISLYGKTGGFCMIIGEMQRHVLPLAKPKAHHWQ